MSQEIQDFLERLNREDLVGTADFKRIIARLLSDTIIMADDSQVEAELYDKGLLVRSDLAAVFSLFGLSVVHSERLRYFRVYPPAATSPGATDRGDLHRSEASLYRRSLGPGVGVLLFVLRVIYAHGLLEGRVVKGNFVTTDVGEINIVLKNRTGRDPLPAAHRKSAFRELASLWRVLRYDGKANLNEPSTQVLVHPIICDLVSDVRAQAALDALKEDPTAGEGEELQPELADETRKEG